MNDARVRYFGRSLCSGGAEQSRALIDVECLMVLPTPPFALGGDEAIAVVSYTPRWTEVSFADQRIARPEEGLIVVSYLVDARRKDEHYLANCFSTYCRRGDEDWQVAQHQQTLRLAA